MERLSELIERLNDAIKEFGDLEYEVTGAYASSGSIFEIVKDSTKDIVYIQTDIMTG